MTVQSNHTNNSNFAFSFDGDGEQSHFSTLSNDLSENNSSILNTNLDPNKNTFQKRLTSKKTKFKARRGAELSNYLQNTLATVSDRKFYVYQNKLLQYGQAEVVTSQDYYPFGMEMMGSSDLYNPTNTDEFSGRVYHNKSLTDRNFRYGFNGKEKDDAFHDNITNYDYGFRIYNPGISRFLSVDPLTRDFPSLTPYQYASNTPIMAKDLDGLEGVIAISDIPQVDDVGATDVVVYDDIKKSIEGYNIAVQAFGREHIDRLIRNKSTDYLVVDKTLEGNKYRAINQMQVDLKKPISEKAFDLITYPSRKLGGYVQENHPNPNNMALELNAQGSTKGGTAGYSAIIASDGISSNANAGPELSSDFSVSGGFNLNFFYSKNNKPLNAESFAGYESNLSVSIPFSGFNVNINLIDAEGYNGIGIGVEKLGPPSVSTSITNTTIISQPKSDDTTNPPRP